MVGEKREAAGSRHKVMKQVVATSESESSQGLEKHNSSAADAGVRSKDRGEE